jgi:signal transduction histidine kinase
MPLRRKIRSGYILAFALLLICYYFIFQSFWNVQKEYDWVTDSYMAETKIGELKNSIIEAETGVSGFYNTKDTTFLKSYLESLHRVPVIYLELKNLEEKDPDQLGRLDTIKQFIDLRLALMTKNINLFRFSGSTAEFQGNRQRGLAILDSIRIHTQDFINAEEKLMVQRKSKLTRFFNATLIITIVSFITAVLAICYSLYTYNKESRARDESTKKNIQYQRDLEKNITELRRMDAEVKELRSLEKFTATGRVARTIAHEVRNPLTNISLAAEQLKDLNNESQEPAMLLEMINRNTVRINQLISDLLNATKSIQLDIKKVRINEVIDETLGMANDRIDLSQVKVVKDYAADPCEVAVDKEKIKIAFLNIIINAIEAMEKGQGLLVLKTRMDGSRCVVEIIDNGLGMNEDTSQKMFEPYFSNKPKGNGLGLTNTQNIILTHKGKIDISTRPGKGTQFIVTLDTEESVN